MSLEEITLWVNAISSTVVQGFDSFMLKQGFSISNYDCCVYIHKLRGDDYIYLLLYVDDMLIASKSKVKIDRLKTQLGEEFETKDLGAANKILGMEIRRERSNRKLFLSQKGYIERVIERFGTKSAKSVVTPLAPHFRLSGKQSPTYAGAVGSLMYTMEALWLRGILDDLGLKQNSVNLNCDSQSAIHLAKNQVHHARTKHIDVRHVNQNCLGKQVPTLFGIA
uniref:Reverse transcriptase Ty1/copia-type domain-containing protein n=1 Tax=Chenopodium quinoa TaxID=63459 RepID=A0A803M5H2_CHEQI